MRNRTLPGKYMVGSWQSLDASNAQEILEREVIATQRLMVVRCLYKAGSDFPKHVHQQEQLTIVESGHLEVDVEDERIEIGPGQMVTVFAGVHHASRVLGDEPVRALNLFLSQPA